MIKVKKLFVLSLLLLATAYAHKLPPTSHGSYTGDAVVGQLLNFSGASSQDNDQQTLNYTPKYEWDFSYNGTFSPDTTVISSSVNHRYGTAGSYTVAIRYTDNDNQQGNIYTFTITIEPLIKRYYYVKDHLGNIRQTLDEGGNIVSAQDYYPFGGIYRAVNTADANDKYKFTEKERDKETDYDYFGARYYDSDLGRWLSVDPLAEKYAGWSPYNYGLNNPLRNIDPDGDSIIVLLNPNGAKGLGHAAELIGNENSGWDLYSKNGAKGLYGLGPSKKPDVGSKTEDHYSNIADFAAKNKDYKKGYLIEANGKQDGKMKITAEKEVNSWQVAIGNNCMDAVSATLESVGFNGGTESTINPSGPSIMKTYSPVPNERYNSVVKNNEGVDVTEIINGDNK